MAQNIEFFLHPPSPKLSPNHNTQKRIPLKIDTVLPPVSSLFSCSPNSSFSSSSSSSNQSNELPILLSPALSSSSSHSSIYQQQQHSPLLEPHPQQTSSSPSLPPFMSALTLDSPLQSPSSINSFKLLLPLPNRSRSRSISSTCSSVSSFLSLNDSLSPVIYQEEEQQLHESKQEEEHEEEETNIVIPNNPITAITTTKRKRGRPPNTSKPTQNQQPQQRDNWTFITPTVWDVHHQNVTYQPQEIDQITQAAQEEEEEKKEMNGNMMTLQWPSSTNDKKQYQEQGQNIFTNTTMDTTLSMPKKKRGRKPKMQLAGNFCFVWRDLTAPRTTKANGSGTKKRTKKRDIVMK